MSTFESFMRGRSIGEAQAKQKRVDATRQQAADAFGAGNYENAESLLMGIGALDEANAYGMAGERRKAAERQQTYADAYKTGGPKGQMETALGFGDTEMATSIQEFITSSDESQRTAFTESMEFLGQTALGLKGVPPEMRGQAAMEILQNTPFANEQVMAAINQAAADGKITDDELDRFATQTMSAAEQVKMAQPDYEMVTGQDSIFAVDKKTLDKTDLGIQPKQPAANNVTVNNTTGGPEPTPMQKKVDEAWAPILVEWQRLGASDSLKQLSQLDAVVNALESGENISGPMLGAIPPGLRVFLNPNSVENQQQVEEVVQRNLRAVLGAQFTQKEGDRLIARAYNPQLSEATNKRRLARLMGQMSLSAQQIEAALDHANAYGTMIGFDGQLPTVADFDAALDAAGAPQVNITDESRSPADWQEDRENAASLIGEEKARRLEELRRKQGR